MDEKQREAHLERAIEEMEERKKKFLELRNNLKNGKAPPELPTYPPLDKAGYYAKWFQQLVPIRTNCFRCGIDSPIVHTTYGPLAFGGPIRRGERDVTEDVVQAFEKIGWRFQKNRSYCGTCKKLGSV